MSLKSDLEKLSTISVRGERYVKLAEVLALVEKAEQPEPKKADAKQS